MGRVEGKIATGRFRSNMAAVFDRKVHAATLKGKLACPHSSCSKKPTFYQKSVIFHHYKTIHGSNVPSSFFGKKHLCYLESFMEMKPKHIWRTFTKTMPWR